GEDAAAALTALLRLRGFDAQTARTASDALAATATDRPHVVVLDLDLPDGDGCELIRRVRAVAEPPAVVVVTGHTDLARRPAAPGSNNAKPPSCGALNCSNRNNRNSPRSGARKPSGPHSSSTSCSIGCFRSTPAAARS